MTFYDFLAKFAWFRREIYFGRSVAHAFLLGAAKYGDPDRLRQYLTGKKVGDQGMYLVPKAVQYLSQETKNKSFKFRATSFTKGRYSSLK